MVEKFQKYCLIILVGLNLLSLCNGSGNYSGNSQKKETRKGSGEAKNKGTRQKAPKANETAPPVGLESLQTFVEARLPGMQTGQSNIINLKSLGPSAETAGPSNPLKSIKTLVSEVTEKQSAKKQKKGRKTAETDFLAPKKNQEESEKLLAQIKQPAPAAMGRSFLILDQPGAMEGLQTFAKDQFTAMGGRQPKVLVGKGQTGSIKGAEKAISFETSTNKGTNRRKTAPGSLTHPQPQKKRKNDTNPPDNSLSTTAGQNETDENKICHRHYEKVSEKLTELLKTLNQQPPIGLSQNIIKLPVNELNIRLAVSNLWDHKIAEDTPNMSISDPNMSGSDPNMSKNDPNMSISDPNMSISDPTMSISDPNMSISDPNMSISDPNMSGSDTNMSKNDTPAESDDGGKMLFTVAYGDKTQVEATKTEKKNEADEFKEKRRLLMQDIKKSMNQLKINLIFMIKLYQEYENPDFTDYDHSGVVDCISSSSGVECPVNPVDDFNRFRVESVLSVYAIREIFYVMGLIEITIDEMAQEAAGQTIYCVPDYAVVERLTLRSLNLYYTTVRFSGKTVKAQIQKSARSVNEQIPFYFLEILQITAFCWIFLKSTPGTIFFRNLLYCEGVQDALTYQMIHLKVIRELLDCIAQSLSPATKFIYTACERYTVSWAFAIETVITICDEFVFPSLEKSVMLVRNRVFEWVNHWSFPIQLSDEAKQFVSFSPTSTDFIASIKTIQLTVDKISKALSPEELLSLKALSPKALSPEELLSLKALSPKRLSPEELSSLNPLPLNPFSSQGLLSQNPSPLNPSTQGLLSLNPSPLNPSPLNPSPLNPSTQGLLSQNPSSQGLLSQNPFPSSQASSSSLNPLSSSPLNPLSSSQASSSQNNITFGYSTHREGIPEKGQQVEESSSSNRPQQQEELEELIQLEAQELQQIIKEQYRNLQEKQQKERQELQTLIDQNPQSLQLKQELQKLQEKQEKERRDLEEIKNLNPQEIIQIQQLLESPQDLGLTSTLNPSGQSFLQLLSQKQQTYAAKNDADPLFSSPFVADTSNPNLSTFDTTGLVKEMPWNTRIIKLALAKCPNTPQSAKKRLVSLLILFLDYYPNELNYLSFIDIFENLEIDDLLEILNILRLNAKDYSINRLKEASKPEILDVYVHQVQRIQHVSRTKDKSHFDDAVEYLENVTVTYVFRIADSAVGHMLTLAATRVLQHLDQPIYFYKLFGFIFPKNKSEFQSLSKSQNSVLLNFSKNWILFELFEKSYEEARFCATTVDRRISKFYSAKTFSKSDKSNLVEEAVCIAHCIYTKLDAMLALSSTTSLGGCSSPFSSVDRLLVVGVLVYVVSCVSRTLCDELACVGKHLKSNVFLALQEKIKMKAFISNSKTDPSKDKGLETQFGKNKTKRYLEHLKAFNSTISVLTVKTCLITMLITRPKYYFGKDDKKIDLHQKSNQIERFFFASNYLNDKLQTFQQKSEHASTSQGSPTASTSAATESNVSKKKTSLKKKKKKEKEK